MKRSTSHFDFVQIGAHLADQLTPAAKQGAQCLFIEPVPTIFEALRKKFAALPNVVVENAAVAATSGRRRIHFLANTSGLPFWADQIGSLRHDHIVELAAQSGFGDAPRSRMTSAEVLCLTPSELLAKYSTSRVENLIVDAEGADYEILSALDFSKVRIARLVFERKHMDGVRQTGYRYNHIVDKLRQIGYSVRHLDHQNDEAVLQASSRELHRRLHAYRREQFLEPQSKPRKLNAPTSESSRAKSPRGSPQPNAVQTSGSVTPPDCGVVYMALGRRHFLEALQSISSLRIFHADLPVTIFTDESDVGAPGVTCVAMGDGRSPFKQKIAALLRSPYRKTLFLDTDTLVVGSLGLLFRLLRERPWCIAEAPRFHFDDGAFIFDGFQSPGIFNTGVIAFETNEPVQSVLDAWATSMASQPDEDIRPGRFCDQWYFNKVVAASEAYVALRPVVLDNLQWNLRSYALRQAARDGVLSAARIIHARPWEVRQFCGMDLAAIVKEIVSRRSCGRNHQSSLDKLLD